MTDDQTDLPPSEEIVCRGARTLEHWYEVRKLTRQLNFAIVYHLILAVLFLSTGFTVFESFSLDNVFAQPIRLISFLASTALFVWNWNWTYVSRQRLKNDAAEKRGWFSECRCSTTEEGISYLVDSDDQQCSGILAWANISRFETTDSLIVLYRETPNDYVVLAREFFSSDQVWKQFLVLVEKHTRATPQ